MRSIEQKPGWGDPIPLSVAQIITDFHYQHYQHLPVTLQSGEILMFCPIRPLPAVLWEEECMRKPSVRGQGTPRTKQRLVDALEVQEGHL